MTVPRQEGQSLADTIVSRGEWGLESLKAMPREGVVGKVLEQLADPKLEQRIMRGIENMDTDKVLVWTRCGGSCSIWKRCVALVLPSCSGDIYYPYEFFKVTPTILILVPHEDRVEKVP